MDLRVLSVYRVIGQFQKPLLSLLCIIYPVEKRDDRIHCEIRANLPCRFQLETCTRCLYRFREVVLNTHSLFVKYRSFQQSKPSPSGLISGILIIWRGSGESHEHITRCYTSAEFRVCLESCNWSKLSSVSVKLLTISCVQQFHVSLMLTWF